MVYVRALGIMTTSVVRYQTALGIDVFSLSYLIISVVIALMLLTIKQKYQCLKRCALDVERVLSIIASNTNRMFEVSYGSTRCE